MADVESNTPSLAEQYLLKQIENKSEMSAKSLENFEVNTSVDIVDEVTAKENPTVGSEDAPPAAAENDEKPPESATEDTEDSKASNPAAEATNEADQHPVEESSGNDESENTVNEEAPEETPEIKLETAPADFRFPTTNQTRHCFTRYIEYHRCTAAKGEGASECDKFAKYYRSLCPGEWIEKWNEQRENGTFPGPL